MTDPENYSLSEADRLADEIVRLDPSIKISRFFDYGFAVHASKGEFYVVACQPGTEFQTGVFRTAESVVKELRGH